MLSVMTRFFRHGAISIVAATLAAACGSSDANPGDLGNDSGIGTDDVLGDGVEYDGFRLDTGDGGAGLREVGGSPTTVSASSSPAVGDLDGDGFPEIVAYSKPTSSTGSVIAFTKKGGAWSVLWRAHNVDTTPWTSGEGNHEWAGPSI